jgi:hypothetical protein
MTNVGNGGAAQALPKLRYTTQIPETTRGRGRPGGGENVYQKLMIDMPAPAKGKGKDAPTQFASFFVPVEIPATITDAAEREKTAKDKCNKLVNRFTAVSRRIRKTLSETHAYTFRKARDPDVADGAGAWGVMVYRIDPSMVETRAPRKAAA